MVKTLVAKASEGNAVNEGFEGFETESNASTGDDNVDREPEPSDNVTTENMEGKDVPESSPPVANPSKMTSLLEEDMKFMVDQIMDRITPVLQACCVTDRLEKAEQNAEEWKSMANLFMKNPQFAARKLSMSMGDNKMAVAPGRHPMEQTWDQFIQTPIAAPIWTLIIKLDLHPQATMLTRWWKKVKSDNRMDTWSKLSKYLQAIRYFNNSSDSFWRKFSVNPTYFSIQRICTELVTQANWLKASGLEMPRTLEKFIKAATEIATSSGKVSDIEAILATHWPANFRPHKLHYDDDPFADTILFAQEDDSICMNTAVLKGFEFTHTEFRAQAPTKKEPTMLTKQAEAMEAKPKPKLSEVSKMIEEILQSAK